MERDGYQCDVTHITYLSHPMMRKLQTRIEMSFSYSISYSHSNLKSSILSYVNAWIVRRNQNLGRRCRESCPSVKVLLESKNNVTFNFGAMQVLGLEIC